MRPGSRCAVTLNMQRGTKFKNPHAHQLPYLFLFRLVFILYTTGFEGLSLLFHEYTNIFSHEKQARSQLSSWVWAEHVATNGRCGGNTWQRLFHSNHVCEMKGGEDGKEKYGL